MAKRQETPAKAYVQTCSLFTLSTYHTKEFRSDWKMMIMVVRRMIKIIWLTHKVLTLY